MKKIASILSLFIILLTSCSEDEKILMSSEKKIIAFSFTPEYNDGLTQTYIFSINKTHKQITTTLPQGSNVTNLCPSFDISLKAKLYVNGILQKSGTNCHDFSEPMEYEIVSEDGTSEKYTVIVDVEKSSSNFLTSIAFMMADNMGLESNIICDFQESERTFTVKFPYGSDITNLVPTFTISEYAKLLFSGENEIISGTSNIDLSVYLGKDVSLVVEAENGDINNYLLRITIEKIQSILPPEQVLVSQNFSLFNVELKDKGDAAITEIGICWGNDVSPNINNNKLSYGGKLEKYRFRLNNLNEGATYYVRAYSISNFGITYSDDITITMLNNGELPKFIKPLINNQWQAHAYPYNAYNPADHDGVDEYHKRNNMVNGHYTNACGPTAFARALYAQKYPVDHMTGNFDYIEGGMHFNCNGDNITIDYTTMPQKLSINSSQEEYDEVAKLMQYTTALGEYYGMQADGTFYLSIGVPNITNDDGFMIKMRKYLNTTDDFRVLNRWDYSREEWITIFKTELAAGRTILIAGRTIDSPSPEEDGYVTGHWFNVEGYNEQDEFFVSFNLGEEQTYYDIDDFGQFKAYNYAFIGLIPNE